VNPQQLRAFLGLRWRLLVNQMHRGGIANVVIVSIMAISLILLGGLKLIESRALRWQTASNTLNAEGTT